ncbi:MAG: DoxX family protein [Propioniciclava sp.]
MNQSSNGHHSDPESERTVVVTGDAEATVTLPTDTAATAFIPGFGDPEATQVIPTAAPPPAAAALPHAQYDAHRTQVMPTGTAAPPSGWAPPDPYLPGTPDPYPAPVADPSPTTTEAEALRASDTWAWQMSRTQNRASTDIGLLLLRLCSLPLILHGIRGFLNFSEYVAQVRAHPLGAPAPEVLGIAMLIAQVLLPVLIALGFGTRIAALIQALVMGGMYALWVLAGNQIVDPDTGALAAEISLVYAAFALPLVFTGPGRFSLDHGLTAERRDRVVQRRVEKRQRTGNA